MRTPSPPSSGPRTRRSRHGRLDVFCRKRAPLVYATSHTCEMVAETVRSRVAWRKFEAGETFAIEGLRIETFSVPHDAVDPVGFVFRGERTAVGVLSDVGHVTALIRERLRGVDSLFVESNYDELMLQNDTKRPWSTKQRIAPAHASQRSNRRTRRRDRQRASPPRRARPFEPRLQRARSRHRRHPPAPRTGRLSRRRCRVRPAKGSPPPARRRPSPRRR
ncbi:MAG: hypothetical protein H7A53_04480 [Akkermansiaceae bacterium]|nr:hypothetical protein [Akkermansiaceae bacterium]